MSSTQRLVSPKLPTALANQTHVDLPGYDIWLFYVNTVHVLPAELDVLKFEDALSRVLQLYPHAAGQLRHIDGRWSIELTNTAIPLHIDYRLDTSSDSLLHGDWTFQDDISSFLNHPPAGANVINDSAPLLRLKLTFFDHETSLGVHWYHSLGDGTVILRFLHTLSQFYQGLPPVFAAPTFKKHHFFPPSHVTMPEFRSRMPCVHETCDPNELPLAEPHKDVERVMWRIDNHDIEKLRSALSSTRQHSPFLSKQDCIVAYLVAILNCNTSNPVKKVISTVSYRHLNTFVTEDEASNLILDVPATVPMDMAGIANTLRSVLIQSREPDYIYNQVMLVSSLKLEAANGGEKFFRVYENQLITNSHTRIDWHGVHFGCADGIRFHMTGATKFYLNCFRPNPARGDDGAWRARQSVEISMGVPAALKPKLHETLSRGVRYMLDNQPEFECA